MRREFKIQKGVILFVLSALITGDVALAVYSWNRTSQQSAQEELALLQHNVSLLRADIKRVSKIKADMPAVQKDCEEFERSLFPAVSGYSAVNAELSAIAKKSGVQLENRAFRAGEVKGRGLTEVQIDLPVSGNYRAIVNFLNGLQRSPNMYAIDGLSARSDAQNQGAGKMLRVSIHVRTYFRVA